MEHQNQILQTLRAPESQARLERIVAHEALNNRAAVGRRVCAEFGFVDARGSAQLAGCLKALNTLHKAGRIALPASRRVGGSPTPQRFDATLPADALRGPGPLGAREGAGDVAAGRIERSARPLPVAGAGLDQAAQRLVCGAAPRAVLDGHLIARQADRAVDVADGTGPASSRTPYPTAEQAGPQVLRAPVAAALSSPPPDPLPGLAAALRGLTHEAARFPQLIIIYDQIPDRRRGRGFATGIHLNEALEWSKRPGPPHVTPAPGPAATVPTAARCEPYDWHRRTARHCKPWYWQWARNRWMPLGEVSELADAHPLQILNGCPHLLSVPRRPVVAGRYPRYSGAAAHGDETDCETLRSVVLALGQEPLRQGDRRKLVHKRTLPSDSRTAAPCSTSPRWPARASRCSCHPASDCCGAAPRPPARGLGSPGSAARGRSRPGSPARTPRC